MSDRTAAVCTGIAVGAILIGCFMIHTGLGVVAIGALVLAIIGIINS